MDSPADISEHMSAGISACIPGDISADISVDTSADVSGDISAERSADTSADISAGISAGISADICRYVCPNGYCSFSVVLKMNKQMLALQFVHLRRSGGRLVDGRRRPTGGGARLAGGVQRTAGECPAACGRLEVGRRASGHSAGGWLGGGQPNKAEKKGRGRQSKVNLHNAHFRWTLLSIEPGRQFANGGWVD